MGRPPGGEVKVDLADEATIGVGDTGAGGSQQKQSNPCGPDTQRPPLSTHVFLLTTTESLQADRTGFQQHPTRFTHEPSILSTSCESASCRAGLSTDARAPCMLSLCRTLPNRVRIPSRGQVSDTPLAMANCLLSRSRHGKILSTSGEPAMAALNTFEGVYCN